MALYCGDDHVLIYNDAYAGLLGDHHPAALGRPAGPVLAQLWLGGAAVEAVAEVYRRGVAVAELAGPPLGDEGARPAGAASVHSYSAVRDGSGRIVAVLEVAGGGGGTTAAARQLLDLRALTAALAQVVTLDDVARVTMRHAMAAFDVDHVGLALDDGRGWRAVRRVRGDALDEADQRLPPLWHRFPPDAPLPMIQAAVGDTALFLNDVDLETFRQYATDRHDGALRALAALPLPSGRLRGAVTFGYERPHRWHAGQRAMLSAAAELIGRAATRAELYETQYGTSHLLQRSMLPHVLPSVDNFRLAAQYQPGVDGNAAGGDFYDAFVLPADRLVVVLGDVSGHDVHAAAMMGQIRAAVRAFAQIDPAPAQVLRNLDRLIDGLASGAHSDQAFLTLLYGLVDGRTHTVTLAGAGHPAPVLRRFHGAGHPATAAAVPLRPGPPLGLGLGLDSVYPTVTVRLAPGDTLLLFSDGVIERRGQDITDGIDALIAAVAAARTGDVRSLAALTPRIVPGTTEDDIAVLALERAASPSRHTSLHLPPEAPAPGRARRWLLAQLNTWNVADDLAHTAALCLTELATNALLHAGTDTRVEVDLTSERLLITVTDAGTRGELTRPEPSGISQLSSRGRGLNLIEAVTDAWGTEPVAQGTRVWFELLLPAPSDA
jgi:serine phosphatase RsbU (regulator of sigma subunit)/anti-sigma regulatory factor (Ser/Thr protein kinase)